MSCIHNVAIRSTKRTSGTASNARYSLGKGDGKFHGTYLLKYAFLPMTLYNVNSTNNKFLLTDSSVTDALVTITEGSYDTGTFPAALLDALKAASGLTYVIASITINGDTNVLSIAPPSGTMSADFTSYAATARMMGFAAEDSATAATITGVRAVNFGTPMSVGVRIREAESKRSTRLLMESSNRYNFVAPLTANYGGYVLQSSDLFKQYISFGDQYVSELNVEVFDLETNANAAIQDWEMVLSRE